jgi:hypothetical protein
LESRFADWAQQKRQEGEQVGRLAGEAPSVLTRQLERRFGPLPAWARDRIAAANTDALEGWCLRVLDRVSLEDVLG